MRSLNHDRKERYRRKVNVFKEHPEKQASIAEFCAMHRIHSNPFYQWKKALFENAVDIFTKCGRKKKAALPDLEAKIRERKVIAEPIEESLNLKKFNGGL